MFATLLPLFLGSVPSIVKSIADYKLQLTNATTEQQKIEAEENIKALEARRDVLLKEANSPWNNVARFAFLGPFAFYLWWVVAYDKIICKWINSETVCTTDPLSPWLTGIAGLIIGFYFLGDVSKVWKR